MAHDNDNKCNNHGMLDISDSQHFNKIHSQNHLAFCRKMENFRSNKVNPSFSNFLQTEVFYFIAKIKVSCYIIWAVINVINRLGCTCSPCNQWINIYGFSRLRLFETNLTKFEIIRIFRRWISPKSTEDATTAKRQTAHWHHFGRIWCIFGHIIVK